MAEALASEIVKGGSSVLFLDLRQAKNDTLYLSITSLGRNQAGETERQSIRVFGEQMLALRDGLSSIVSSKAYVAAAKPAK